ncbi:MAG TPA: AMP-binding protein [Streptosporangiaceae bacterium]|jgi:acyl-CoA synthetase (AMP-forming)/AMP-acid ligase II
MARSHNLADLLELLAGADPDRPALVAGDRRLTYGELNERAGRIGHHLAAAGVEPGEHVAILAHNRVEWIESMLGAYKVRAVPIPVNFRYVADELRHVLYDSDSVALIEVALKAHPDVYDAVVVGLPDERFGQRVAAAVAPAPGAAPTLERLAEHCRSRMAGFKVPRELRLVDAVQRSATGKSDYTWARSVFAGATSPRT